MSAYIFYGKAGSGKGTQAQKLKEYLESKGSSVIYIETGKLFRDFVQNNNSFSAKRTAEIIDTGALMPAFFPIYMWAQQLVERFTGNEEIILDGVGRRFEEMHILDSALDFLQIAKRHVFHVKISDETSVKRLTIRDEGRSDDANVAKIQKRLDWYQENVLPVFEFFHTHTNYSFAEIDGEVSVEEVFEQIEKVVSK